MKDPMTMKKHRMSSTAWAHYGMQLWFFRVRPVLYRAQYGEGVLLEISGYRMFQYKLLHQGMSN
jgi:hypothetical protein